MKTFGCALLIFIVLGLPSCVALYSFLSPETHEAVRGQPNAWCNFWTAFDRPGNTQGELVKK